MHSEASDGSFIKLQNRIPFTIKISQKNMKITIEKNNWMSRFNQFLPCDINIK